MFLMSAAAYAYKIGAADIVIGVCGADQNGFPDCSDEAMKATESALSIGMGFKLTVHTPLMDMSKKEIVFLLKELGGFEYLKYSHTCFEGLYPPCGECLGCKLRKDGFAEADLEDPLLV
jgi:7-cyano-7-deazaguanine synthase